MVASHLPHSSLVDRQKSRISHVRHPAAVPASEDHEGAGATFAADARVFPQFFLKQGEAEFECLSGRAFFAEERLENEVQMKREVVGGEISAMTVKHSEILVGALVSSSDSLHCNSVLIFSPSSNVSQIGILFRFLLHLLHSLSQLRSLIQLQNGQIAERFTLLQQNLVAIVCLPRRNYMGNHVLCGKVTSLQLSNFWVWPRGEGRGVVSSLSYMDLNRSLNFLER